jgi:hypothetical protein
VTDPASAFGSDVGHKLLAIHQALAWAGIEHAFGGAIALAYAVPEPRATIDLDINIGAPVSAAARVLAALPAGVVGRPDVVERIASDGQDRLRWGDVAVDLFFPQHGFHAVVAARALRVPFRQHVIPVLSPTDLTVFKALFNRRKDWADIESMLRAGGVDTAEARRWVRVVVGTEHPSYRRLEDLIDEVGADPGNHPSEPVVDWGRPAEPREPPTRRGRPPQPG